MRHTLSLIHIYLRKNRAGEVREYIVNPYQIVGVNGRYYLICNNDKYDEISNYRVERIVDIRLLDTPWKPFKKVKGLENGFDLPRHMAEHIYMFTGPSETVTFQLKKYLVGEVLDWFGKEIVFFDETDEDVSARVHVNCEAMRKWALQYALHVKVLSPPALVDQVKEDIETSLKNYSE